MRLMPTVMVICNTCKVSAIEVNIDPELRKEICDQITEYLLYHEWIVDVREPSETCKICAVDAIQQQG